MERAELDRLRSIVDLIAANEARAKKRFEAVESPSWYYGIVGIELEKTPIQVGHFFTIREVEESAGEVSLAKALKNQAEFGTVGRYARIIRHQMVLRTPMSRAILNTPYRPTIWPMPFWPR